MDFGNVALTKVIHIYAIGGMNASICSQNVFVSNM
jgi:hypothetical protein